MAVVADLKSAVLHGRVGSSPTPGTSLTRQYGDGRPSRRARSVLDNACPQDPGTLRWVVSSQGHGGCELAAEGVCRRHEVVGIRARPAGGSSQRLERGSHPCAGSGCGGVPDSREPHCDAGCPGFDPGQHPAPQTAGMRSARPQLGGHRLSTHRSALCRRLHLLQFDDYLTSQFIR